MTPKKHRGCVNELRATAWLMDNGYEVCRNISPHGPVDLVAIKGDSVILIDVKGAYLRQDGALLSAGEPTEQQKKLGVVRLLVLGEEVQWATAVKVKRWVTGNGHRRSYVTGEVGRQCLEQL